MKVKKKAFLIIGSAIILLCSLAYSLVVFTPLGRVLDIYGLSLSALDRKEAGSRNQDILHYNLFIELLPEEEKILGETKITCLPYGNQIRLDFYDNMEIEKLTANSRDVSYEHDDDLIEIESQNGINDTVTIWIKYHGSPESRGLGSFNFDKYAGSDFVYTLNEPFYASTWFPCSDIPNDKATFEISIAADSNLVSLSNGLLIDEYFQNGKKVYHWKTNYPMSTYLAAIYSAPYVNFSQQYVSLDKTDTMDIEYFVTKNKLSDAETDFEDHPQILQVLAELFGEYPFINEKYAVAEFLWAYGAMEHQTITGFGVNFISGKKFYKDVLVHEAAHHWWGDAVGPKTWKDIWLNEGFSSYSEALYFEKISGESALRSTMRSYMGEFDGTTLYNPEGNIFTKVVYNKGAWVLHMLRNELGDDKFFEIIRNYFKKYKYKNASTEDFKSICEKLSGKNLDNFFEQWVYEGTGIIEGSYSWRQNEESSDKIEIKIELKQEQSGFKVYQFPLDIEYSFEDGSSILKRYSINKREQIIREKFEKIVDDIAVDPELNLLADFYLKRN